jgi:hypothetical protein
LLENKKRYIESVVLGDHKFTIYENDKERDLFALLFLQSALKRNDVIVVFSGKSHQLSQLVRKKRSLLQASKRGKIVFLNANEVYNSDDPSLSFSKLFDSLVLESKKQRKGLSFLGDCPPPAYQRFKSHYGIENLLDARNRDPRTTILCIYRNEGLSSLDPSDFVFIYDSHDSVFLNDIELQRSSRLAN